MARIIRKNTQNTSIREAFTLFISHCTAKGLKEKSIQTYQQHFNSVSKRLNVNVPIGNLKKSDLEKMIVVMRKDKLTDQSINSFTRTFKSFLSWCNENGYTEVNIPLYKASEAVKETYTDEELEVLLKKPKANAPFCEYRNWAIVNFLVNGGSRASTIRHIQNQDVDLKRRQIIFRHTKSGKIQVIPLCSEMVNILREYMEVRKGEPKDYLFCNEFGEMFSESGLRCAIEKYNKSRGISRTSIHAFRHTFARKYLIDCGGNAFTLQKLLGHSTLKMTKHYCSIYDADIVRNYDDFSPLAQIGSMKKAIKR